MLRAGGRASRGVCLAKTRERVEHSEVTGVGMRGPCRSGGLDLAVGEDALRLRGQAVLSWNGSVVSDEWEPRPACL